MTYEYVCYTCGMPSTEPTCESCATHFNDGMDLPEYGPLTLYDTFLAEGMTHEEILDLEERCRLELIKLEVQAEITEYMNR